MLNKYFANEYGEIYSYKTKQYFREVVSSYENENYRSTVVMLYSLVICDLLFKLQELKDVYNDTKAEQILTEINKSRNTDNKKEKSYWEHELVENIKKETELLEADTYKNIDYLYYCRNLCAHPVLNDDYDLYLPNSETVAALIRNMLDGVFTKPPIFAKKITNTLTNDLSNKKEIYVNDYPALCRYLENKYFSKMSDKMFITVFKAIWKFVFALNNNECKINREINKRCLQYMLEARTDILIERIKNDKTFDEIITEGSMLESMIVLCSQIPEMFNALNDDLKFQIIKATENDDSHIFLLLWFAKGSFKEYFKMIMSVEYVDKCRREINKEIFDIMKAFFLKEGHQKEFIDFIIYHFSLSYCFNYADNRFTYNIKPMLRYFTIEQAETLICKINNNSQIHKRGQSYDDNNLIITNLKDLLGKDFDYSKYPNFEFNEKLLSESNVKNDNEDINHNNMIEDKKTPF